MTFKTEFPDFPEADMPSMPAGFDDTSWHNNTCPSFTSDELGLTIWIDYADPAKREYQTPHPRFHVERQKDGIETGEEVITTDDWQQVLDAVRASAAR